MNKLQNKNRVQFHAFRNFQNHIFSNFILFVIINYKLNFQKTFVQISWKYPPSLQVFVALPLVLRMNTSKT